MNLIDLLIFVIFVFFAVFAMYRGFLNSALKAAGTLVSAIAAMILHPLLALILGSRSVINFLITYTEGSLKLSDTLYVTMPVAGQSEAQLMEIVDKSSLSMPFSGLVRKNLTSMCFEGRGLTTIGEDFDETVAQASLNILCFFLLFLIFRLIVGIYINVMDYKRPFPVLVQHELPFAALAGVVQAFVLCYCVFMLMPFLLSVFDVPVIVSYVNSSFLGSLFYKTNIFLLLIGGR